MSIVKQISILLFLAALVGGGLYFKFGDTNKSSDDSNQALVEIDDGPVPVIVQEVEYASAAAVIEAVGSGKAIQAVTLYPEISARVTAILFKAGQKVSQGDELLRMDDDEQKLAVQLAQVELEDFHRQLKRYVSTAPSGAVSSSEVDSARSAVEAAKVRLLQAELALQRRTLKAPFSGVVSFPDVDVGDRVSTSAPITTLDDRSSLLVDFEVPEAYSGGVHLGMNVTAITWALPGENFQGVVDSVASRIDDQTRTLQVRTRIENADDRLRTGMSFIIRLPLRGDKFPSVPSISVQWDRTGPYVWRIVNNIAERVSVDVMKREKQWILIDAPINSGDQIVIEGVQRLREGRQVTILNQNEIAAGNAKYGET